MFVAPEILTAGGDANRRYFRVGNKRTTVNGLTPAPMTFEPGTFFIRQSTVPWSPPSGVTEMNVEAFHLAANAFAPPI